MAYDLTIDPQIKPVGAIDYHEIDIIIRLNEKYNHWIFQTFFDLYKDQKIGISQLEEAQSFLLNMLYEDLSVKEKNFLYKMISVITFALQKEKPLLGIAD